MIPSAVFRIVFIKGGVVQEWRRREKRRQQGRETGNFIALPHRDYTPPFPKRSRVFLLM